jgi:hypothetical protein
VQVCCSLFEKDKLLFAFLMTVHLKAHVHHSMDWALLRFLLTGGLGVYSSMLWTQWQRCVCVTSETCLAARCNNLIWCMFRG